MIIVTLLYAVGSYSVILDGGGGERDFSWDVRVPVSYVKSGRRPGPRISDFQPMIHGAGGGTDVQSGLGNQAGPFCRNPSMLALLQFNTMFI